MIDKIYFQKFKKYQCKYTALLAGSDSILSTINDYFDRIYLDLKNSDSISTRYDGIDNRFDLHPSFKLYIPTSLYILSCNVSLATN